MNYQELQDEVSIAVTSSTTELDELIPGLVNDAVAAIANEPGVILPALKSITSVTLEANETSISLTSVDSTKLLFAAVNGSLIYPENSLEAFLEKYPDLTITGDVEAIVYENSTLWYARKLIEELPATLLLYKNPDLLEETTDIPSCIPPHLHRETIIPYCAAYLWDKIEHEMELQQKTQTKAYEYQYTKGLQKLKEYLASRRRGMVRSVWSV
ncbi:MAG: hypothetical protein UU74_C0033G0022 [Candidatus Woesebacteria bacterium GW2011_GWA1_41_7]|uniref:Uncharacterized protein n=1 Tax=Candidatus Woesebacteria bacterium GW2011_GWA1_41_7 TaxID=1618556 RepID=A0A0G0WVP5_9BACT|nr:MAG: hypothetical protein UU74_C0033G0022 [Candidatus Woesebacteria bacterium GW2011_GWA1_41_7]